MPSSYSNLKFEVIPTGEQSGTWGDTTNSNIGTAIDQAIAGMAVLTSSDFTANVATLSWANTPDAQDARAACLVIDSGAVSAAGTVVVPAIEKPYIVINNSSYAVTVKVSGQTGVSVPAGKRTVLYNNGTDVAMQLDYAPALTATTMTATTMTATTATASTFGTSNFTFTESGGKLYIKYGATSIASIDSSGVLTTLADVAAYGTP